MFNFIVTLFIVFWRKTVRLYFDVPSMDGLGPEVGKDSSLHIYIGAVCWLEKIHQGE